MIESLTFKFLSPLWLLALPVVWLIIIMFFKHYHQHSMWEQVCDQHLLNKLIPNAVKAKTGKWLTWVLIIAFSLGILAAAGPSWRSQPIPLFESAASRVVVLDLSRSMLAQDVKPTRFKRAVYKARDLILAQQDGQSALVAFAGAAFVVSPLTDDKKTLLNFLDSLYPGIMPVQGSRIDLSLSVAKSILNASITKTGEIFVLTDGASQLDLAMQAASQNKDDGNTVSILAFGTEQGGPIKDSTGHLVRDEQGELIIAKVGFDDLQSIAEAGAGRFVKMTASDQDINYLLSSISPDEVGASVDSEDRTLQLPINDGIWLVWLMLPFALLLFRKNTFWIVLVFSISPFDQTALASDWLSIFKNENQRAYEAYQSGEFKQAQNLAKDSQLKGASAYKSENFKNAESLFAQQGGATSFYNRGNSLAYMQQFDHAIAAYDKAIELNPDFELAKQNKRLIEEFLKQQQGQQNSKQDKDDKGDESSDDSSDQSESDQSESDQSNAPNSSPDDELQSDSDQEQRQQPNQVQADQSPSDELQPMTEEELALKEQLQQQANNPQAIDRWINRLPDDPSELLRRKFLRDYQRQQNRP